MKSAILQALAMSILGTGMYPVAYAQMYPNKPIKIIVPISPGSGTDVIARVVADRLGSRLGVPVIVENKAGAGTTVASAFVSKADPDGYTLLANSSALVVAPWIYPKLTYDGLKDLTGISSLASLPNVLVVSTSNNIKNMPDFMVFAKGRGRDMNYASAGVGSATHMNAERFRFAAKLPGEHVAYKGTPEAISETIGRRVDWFFSPIASALPLIKDKRLTPIAVGSRQRSSLLPDIPTTEEAGFKNSAYNFWIGLFAPSRTPKAVIEKLNFEIAEILKEQVVRDKFEALGADPIYMSSRDFQTFLGQEYIVNGEIVKAAKVTLGN